MGDGDVVHGGLLRDAEQAHELQRVAGLERLVEDPVLSQAVQREPLGQVPVEIFMLADGWSRSSAARWLTSRWGLVEAGQRL